MFTPTDSGFDFAITLTNDKNDDFLIRKDLLLFAIR